MSYSGRAVAATPCAARRTARLLRILIALACIATVPRALRAQSDTARPPRSDTLRTPKSDTVRPNPDSVAVPTSDTVVLARTLKVGERLSYDVRFGPIKVGRASMEVVGIEEVRGRRAWHTRFQVTGGTLFFRVNDVLESWIDVETFSSLRFHQILSEGSRDRTYEYEIFPERAAFIEKGKPERPSVAQPLDDGSFLYFLRTIPLEVGATYEFPRYFIPDRNPVRLEVIGRDRIDVPAGRYNALVVRPVIKAKGVFSEDGRAQIWISDDADQILLQMTSHLKFGTLSLYFRSRSIRPPNDTASSTSVRTPR